MKRILLVAMLVAGSAQAGEVTVKVSDQDQAAFTNLPGAVDQCVAGLTLRGEGQVCKLIATFLTEFGAKVKAAAPPPSDPAPAPPAKK